MKARIARTLALVVTRGFCRHDAGLFFSATAIFLVLEMLSRMGTDYASIIESDVNIVVQHTRLDSRQSANALLSTIAFAQR